MYQACAAPVPHRMAPRPSASGETHGMGARGPLPGSGTRPRRPAVLECGGAVWDLVPVVLCVATRIGESPHITHTLRTNQDCSQIEKSQNFKGTYLHF